MTPLVEHSDAQNTSLNIWVKLELTCLWVDENKVEKNQNPTFKVKWSMSKINGIFLTFFHLRI
jgi:hypothetical protein